jgi:hypothetical protein
VEAVKLHQQGRDRRIRIQVENEGIENGWSNACMDRINVAVGSAG